MSRFTTCIAVRTYLRTGSGERFLGERILRPLTKDERRQGVRDELREFVTAHGLPGEGRRRPGRFRRRRDDQGCGADTSLNMEFDSEGAPSTEDQEAMYKLMRKHLERVAYDLAESGIVGWSEIEDVVQEFFGICRDSLKDWNPERAGLKTFLYERVASAKIDYVRYVKREKRAFCHSHLHIANGALDGDAEQDAPASFLSMIDAETIPDRHALDRMLFAWSFSDLVDMLDADERLALDYLIEGHSQEEVAKWMSCTLMQFRRHILQSIQMKAVACGFEPHNGTIVSTR